MSDPFVDSADVRQWARHIDTSRLVEYANKVKEGLAFFSIISTTSPKKAEALRKLISMRDEIWDLIDIIVPEAK